MTEQTKSAAPSANVRRRWEDWACAAGLVIAIILYPALILLLGAW